MSQGKVRENCSTVLVITRVEVLSLFVTKTARVVPNVSQSNKVMHFEDEHSELSGDATF